MFYNHFIVILYHFLVLTYWHSAKCQLLFFACFFTSQEINTKRSPNATKLYGDFLWTRRNLMGQGCAWGVPGVEPNPPGRARRPRRALVGCAHLGCPRTAPLLYRYPNILETRGESMKINSSRHRVQNHQIQSRHHHRGVHHPHRCPSGDAWVVHYRPTGP